MRLALVACSKTKQKKQLPAKDLYSKSSLFRLGFQFAQLTADKVVILSAKHYILEPEVEIGPYNQTLLTSSKKYLDSWYKEVARILNSKYSEYMQIIFCCSSVYYSGLISSLTDRTFIFPVKGLAIGKQLAFYKREIETLERRRTNTLV